MGKAKPKSKPRSKVTRAKRVLVTPKMATGWLETNTNNRPCPEVAVSKLAAAIMAGEWRDNGETIKFNCKGNLVDGQTRLKAIIKAGIGVSCWVVSGVSDDAFDTIDQGRSRSISDVFARNGYLHYAHLSTAVRWLYRLDDTIPTQMGGLRAPIALSIVEERPALLDSMRSVKCVDLSRITSVGMAVGLHYLMTQKDCDLADRFWTEIIEGIHVNKRSPIKALREEMLRNKDAARKRSPTAMCALAIKAWNMAREGRSCSHLRWDAEKEQFPSIR